MKIHFIAEKINEDTLLVTTPFGQFEIAKGRHINSIGNMRRWLRYDRRKKVYVGCINGQVNCTRMVNMVDTYRLTVSSNQGMNGYFTTSDISVSREVFEIIAKEGNKIFSKQNREVYSLGELYDFKNEK